MSTVATLRSYIDANGNTGSQLFFWCPGCDALHAINPGVWAWDQDLIAPTISPSILTHGSVHMCPPSYRHEEICENPSECGNQLHIKLSAAGEDPDVFAHPKPHIAEPAFGNCHAFLRNGQWEFLGDSAHSLAGQTAQMVPLPEWMQSEE